ncbi:MAG TPA: AGE family epimerase/isomerase [Polyangiaceae bacterium]|nr:AGE family epimerase/isomerase [Polyangiaceae bacterium]
MKGSAARAVSFLAVSLGGMMLGGMMLGGMMLGCAAPQRPLGQLEARGSERAPTAPVLWVSRAGSGVSESESKGEDRLGNIRVRLEALAAGLMEFWKSHGPDRKYGGIYGFLDRKGTPREDADKGLIQQARQLWSFSTWYARREKTPEVKAIADSIYQFLISHFQDQDGEFFYKVSRDGSKVTEPKKQLYAESFAIYALATYADVFAVPDASKRALACFQSIDRRMHDAQYLGYDQTNDPGWLAPGAQKDTNTHIHLLESFTALYRSTKDEAVKARLEELVKVVATRIVQPSNYAHKEFYRDWRIHDKPVVSYGHDLETTWLLIDAQEALGDANEAVRQVALGLGKHSAERGYDAANGGYFEEGVPGGAPTKLEKVFWIQAEALPGLWWLYRLGNDAGYLDRLEGTLSWIEAKQLDREYGEWFWGIDPDGSVSARGDHKGEEWKAQYHALRALLFTSDWIDQLLSRAPARDRAAAAAPAAVAGGGAPSP